MCRNRISEWILAKNREGVGLQFSSTLKCFYFFCEIGHLWITIYFVFICNRGCKDRGWVIILYPSSVQSVGKKWSISSSSDRLMMVMLQHNLSGLSWTPWTTRTTSKSSAVRWSEILSLLCSLNSFMKKENRKLPNVIRSTAFLFHFRVSPVPPFYL